MRCKYYLTWVDIAGLEGGGLMREAAGVGARMWSGGPPHRELPGAAMNNDYSGIERPPAPAHAEAKSITVCR